MFRFLLLIAFVSLSFVSLDAQVNFNANTQVNDYEGYFRPGVNLGYYPPYTDENLASMAAGDPAEGLDGIGAKTIRPSFPEFFAEQWGYDVRLDAYQHYQSVGLDEMTMIVGYPSPDHKSTEALSCGGTSQMFKNLYTPIWDGGANGTPYNDENYLAAYMYKTVTLYGDNIRFWEIWNEPGNDVTGNVGWRPPGDANGNWWDRDPEPCELLMKGSIQQYIRTLRVCYEVIKTLSPDDYVVVAGVGYESFLDAILRNTDNPNGGAVSAEYPNKGGAYFDVMGFHSYPDIDGSLRSPWMPEINGFEYYRHTDKMAESIVKRKTSYAQIMANYGYGTTYPEKKWIITEMNIPRKRFNPESLANGTDVQVNYIPKAVVTAMRNNIHQMQIFGLCDRKTESEATDEFHLYGLYKNVTNTIPFQNLEMLPEGRAYKTTSDFLFTTRYDAVKSAAMNMPDNVDGGAFKRENGDYVYVLWAKTTVDRSEDANASYSFPFNFNLNTVSKREWDYSATGNKSDISAQNIQLTARPIFISENLNEVGPIVPAFTSTTTIGCDELTIDFTDESQVSPTSWFWEFQGGTPATSTEKNPSVTYTEEGVFDVKLTVSNATYTQTLNKINLVKLLAQPTIDFNPNISFHTVEFTNTSTSGDTYWWGFGDGETSELENPIHIYDEPGEYEVLFLVNTECGQFSETKTITIVNQGGGGVTMPIAKFDSDKNGGCAGMTVQFLDQSTNNPTSWNWSFAGGVPSSSTEQNPIITYPNEGTFSVVLVSTNQGGADSEFKGEYIFVDAGPSGTFTSSRNGLTVSFESDIEEGMITNWNFGDDSAFSQENNPTHTYTEAGTYTVTLKISNDCGHKEIEKLITVTEGGGSGANPPVANFSTNTTNGCLGTSITFSDLSTNTPTSWAWTFPGGTPESSTAQNPTVVYNEAGLHSVVLTVTNTDGTSTKPKLDLIEIIGNPEVNFVASNNNGDVSFTSFLNNTSSVVWNFGDGSSSTSENPSNTYVTDGTYTVSLTGTNACGTDVETQTITIGNTSTTNPVANFAVSSTTGCSPFVVQLSDQSTHTTSWEWVFAGGTPSTSNAQNPEITYNNPGVYSITLIAKNSEGVSVKTKSEVIVVEASPEAKYYATINGNEVSFTNNSNFGNSFVWSFGDGTTSSSVSPSHTFTSNGVYTVSLEVTNNCGTDTYEQTITIDVGQKPVVAFTANTQNGCIPLTITFSDKSMLEPTNWSWKFEGGSPSASNEKNPTITYTNPGVYKVELQVSNAYGDDNIIKEGYIHAMTTPQASFYSSSDGLNIDFLNTTPNGTSNNYVWSFGDGTSSTDFSPEHKYSENGNYKVTLTAANICGNSSFESQLNVISTSAHDIFNNIEKLVAFPNPAHTKLTVDTEGKPSDWVDIEIYDMLGKQVFFQRLGFKTGKMKYPINVEKLAMGSYSLRIKTEHQVGLLKIIKSHK